MVGNLVWHRNWWLFHKFHLLIYRFFPSVFKPEYIVLISGSSDNCVFFLDIDIFISDWWNILSYSRTHFNDYFPFFFFLIFNCQNENNEYFSSSRYEWKSAHKIENLLEEKYFMVCILYTLNRCWYLWVNWRQWLFYLYMNGKKIMYPCTSLPKQNQKKKIKHTWCVKWWFVGAIGWHIVTLNRSIWCEHIYMLKWLLVFHLQTSNLKNKNTIEQQCVRA